MNIVIIGPDGSGKTTLSKFLARTLNMDYIKCTYKERNKLRRAENYIQTTKNSIFDRFYYPDHMVYQQVKGVTLSRDEIVQWNDLERKMVEREFVIIYLDAPDDVLAERIARERASEDGDKYVDTDEIKEIKRHYSAFTTGTNIPILELYTGGFISQKTMNRIMEFLDTAEEFYRVREDNFLFSWGVFTGEANTHSSGERLV